jgi:hypothetical protein
MGLFDNVDGLLPGLLPAAWRGRQFWVINAEHSVGRRLHAQLFPGLDLKTHDDLGPLDGPIRLSGLVIGDDYVQQAGALEAAFRQAGPATLIHPWRGPIRCVLLRPATVEYDVKELRVARIDAEFDPVSAPSLLRLVSTLAGALSALVRLGSAATGLVATVLSASPLSLGLYTRGIAATATTVDVAAVWAGRTGRSADLLPAVVAARSAFAAATALPIRSAAAPALAAIAPVLSTALAAVFKPQPAPGIGPGGDALPVVPADPRAGAALMLTIAADLGRRLRPGEPEAVPGLPALAAAPGTSVTERSVLVAAEIAMTCEAARLVATIDFVSRQEAQTYAARLDEALRRSAVSVAAIANDAAAPAATLWRALNDSRAQLAMDLNEAIGRLPSVRLVEVPGNASAILLAQHLAGDDPAAVFPLVADIVRRNRLRHPASLGAGPIEVLR